MSAVIFREVEAISGLKIGIATLNAEKSLNALNFEMVSLLTPQLKLWQSDKTIAMVLLQGAGEKAFCAGGDVVSLYKAMNDATKNEYVERFFSAEYELDYLIHCFEKPLLVWGNGIIMGGGLGLMAGASHRVVTETSRIAMPEITIGLYPDVGGSYFLTKMPEQLGLFLGLTGASINSEDAKYVGLADYFLKAEFKNKLFDELVLTNWGQTVALNHQKLDSVLLKLQQESGKPLQSNIKANLAVIKQMNALATLNEKISFLANVDTDNVWLQKAIKSLNHGSPLSMCLIEQQLIRGQDLPLAECFQMELGLSVKCGQFGEFEEGVRALLIDKDGQPVWRYQSIENVPVDVIADFFESPWTAQTHPLKSLLKD
ncbi:enoyl-CoA hydratase/isomerase family protein [Pseudoalteromonas tunicata]|uniref:enoyl-CoA hydratase/isomerase family protein n=1 Tax=Pseudoalteromonas tunicata TaxID=314281 RepID=UPI00273FE9BE|nr:enoyl-CoA hydratase/isomerase family protein [Pseudoalteromonas tunicata]MDP4982769.1 enoyl-CoA hydratase/isomerase family protein [Pseudoalteromonas tunicata]MDP5212058.1 enoyl-CoA hydratase/isomerase family protein [Pseudoalteromonas tunicata]